jgi:allene oxide cyclase
VTRAFLPHTIAVVAAALVLVVGFATGSIDEGRKAAPADGSSTLHVIEHASTDRVSDVGDEGDSAGDLLTFANELFDADDARRVGQDQGFCVRIVAGASWQCRWTSFLPGGQLTVEGPVFDGQGSRLAVTGGTGIYANVSGWMDLKSREGGARLDFVYHLRR